MHECLYARPKTIHKLSLFQRTQCRNVMYFTLLQNCRKRSVFYLEMLEDDTNQVLERSRTTSRPGARLGNRVVKAEQEPKIKARY